MNRTLLCIVLLCFAGCDSAEPEPERLLGIWFFDGGSTTLTTHINAETPFVMGTAELADDETVFILVVTGLYNAPAASLTYATAFGIAIARFSGTVSGRTLTGTLTVITSGTTGPITMTRQ